METIMQTRLPCRNHDSNKNGKYIWLCFHVWPCMNVNMYICMYQQIDQRNQKPGHCVNLKEANIKFSLERHQRIDRMDWSKQQIVSTCMYQNIQSALLKDLSELLTISKETREIRQFQVNSVPLSTKVNMTLSAEAQSATRHCQFLSDSNPRKKVTDQCTIGEKWRTSQFLNTQPRELRLISQVHPLTVSFHLQNLSAAPGAVLCPFSEHPSLLPLLAALFRPDQESDWTAGIGWLLVTRIHGDCNMQGHFKQTC